MSSIIVDKLKEIEEANKSGYYNCSTCKEISNESGCQALSRAHTVSILTENDSDYYQEYHTVKVWAAKLRSLKSEQRLYAEKAIYDVLLEAQLGNLNKSSVKVNGKIFCTKQSHSVFNAKPANNNSSERSLPVSYHSNTTSSCRSSEHDYRSSEVIIAESFPTEIGVVSSECQVKLDNLSILKPYANQNRKKVIGAVSSLVLPTSSRSQAYDETDSEESIDKFDHFSNVITNTPNYILMQLNRCMSYVYHCIRNYL